MLRVWACQSSAAADGEWAGAAEAGPPRTSGTAVPVMNRPLTSSPASLAYNCQRPAASGQRPAASGQRPAASGQRPAASGPNCDPHSRLGSPRRPDARTGRARRLSLLPVLALLLGALSLFAAGSAEAQGPAAPTALGTTGEDRQLFVSWTAPTGTLTAYHVHYTSAPASGSGAVSNSAAGAADNDASTAWKAVDRSGTTASQTITGLTSGVAYRVRVRAVSSGGNGAWAFTTGTPVFPVVSFSEGTISLDENGVRQATVAIAPLLYIASSITVTLGTGSTAGSGDYTGLPLTLTLPVSNASARLSLGSLLVDDTVNEPDETLVLQLQSIASPPYKLGTQKTLTVTIFDTDPPAAPTGLSVTAPTGRVLELRASWSKPVGPVARYEVRYKQASAADRTSTNGLPSSGWVTVASTETSTTITGLNRGTAYHVQVRANDGQPSSTGNGWGPWTATQSGTTGTVVTPATVTLSASPAQVWEGQASRVTATLSHALPHGVLIPVTVSPCPTGSWCRRFNNYGIHIPAGSTVGSLRGPVNPSAAKLTDVVVDGYHERTAGGYDRFVGVKMPVYAGPQTSLLTVRDADAEHEEITVALGSSLPKNVRAGGKTSQKITVLDPDGFAMTITADKQPAEGGGVVKVTIDLGQPAPPGFYAKINSSASTAKFGHGLDRPSKPDWTMDGKVGIEEPYVAAGPVLPRSTSSTRGPCSRYAGIPKRCVAYISAADWNNRDWQRMHYVKDWNGASKKTLTIQIADDDFVDPGETIVLQGIGYIYAWGIDHGGSTGFPKGQVQSNELRLTIKDNDGGSAADDLILMGMLPTIARESGTGDDSTARMQVWLSRPATQQVTVAYSTVDVFATSPADYTSIPQTTLTFEPGETRKEVEITIKDDTVEDSGEYFWVTFNAPKPPSVVRLVAGGTGFNARVTIINDEADLEGLKLWGAPGSGGPFARLDLGAFDGAVSDYAVTVPHGTTHAKLAGIAPQNEPLTLKAGRAGSTLTAVRSNVAGPAVPLAVGDTVLVVQSTASTGERKTYRVTVTREAQAAVAVSLSATPNPVDEGSPVTVRATLATALSEAVTVPLTVTRGTSEDGDHGSLASIGIPAGGTSATGTISTTDDADGDDETFTVALGSLPSGLAAGSASSVEVTIADSGAQQQQSTEPLTAAFENVPSEHDGTAFTFDLTLSEAPGAGNLPVAASFKVAPGKASVSGSGTRYTVTVTPKAANAWKDVTVTLAGGRACAEAGAICTADGRALSNSASATIGGPVRIRIEGAKAREGKDESLDFAVTLNRAASHEVSVDYATEDGTAAAGADYTATSGTLVFAAGETAKTVSVPLLDDAIDEGKETFKLKLSNPQGAYLRGIHSKAKGVIRNDDPLQAMWLARFGRMVASDAVGAVTARLETPRDAGSHVTFAGQRMNFGEAEGGGGAALATVLTGLAQTFGAPSAPASDEDDPFARHGLTDPWNDSTAATGARRVTARELLLGSSFRAVLGQGAGSQWTSWGQGASVSQFSAGVPGLDLSGESATGSMGMDYERGRLLMGFAMTHSVGEGTATDEGWRYELGSTATMAMPYARLALSERISAWGLAGTGSGTLSLDLDGSVAQRYRTDLAMTLAAAGVRGDLVKPAETGGFALALKADAFWVRTESEAVRATEFGNLSGAQGESSRVRAVLDGSRMFSLASGAALTPKLELGLRHDGGDAETGTGVEFGAGLGFADPSRGLDMALKVHGLAVHAEDGYDEWGVTGQLRLVPGGAGRGLSASLTPSWGVDPSGSERLWAEPASAGLAANGGAEPSSRLDGEVGYGMAVFGGGFTGTPNVGFGMSEAAREYRMGWRLTSAVLGDPGFEVSLDATRREAVNDNDAEHGVMLRSMIRW